MLEPVGKGRFLTGRLKFGVNEIRYAIDNICEERDRKLAERKAKAT